MPQGFRVIAKSGPKLMGICLLLALVSLALYASWAAPVAADEGERADVPPPELNAAPPLAGPDIWRDVDEAQLRSQGVSGTRLIVPAKYRLVAADLAALDALLAQAPLENSAAAKNTETVLSLPLPDGGMQRFRIEAYIMMAPDLAAAFPEIKTYLGRGLDDPTATVRLDRTPAGFHGLILSASETVYIDPYSSADIIHYISYYKRDYRNYWQKTFSEEMLAEIVGPDAAIPGADSPRIPTALNSTGPNLRTYRLAVAATGEYTAFHGGSKAGAQNAIVTTINRVNAIYEREVAVRMILINNQDIIYTNPATDPYANNSGGLMLTQNQVNLDTTIGSANYDIGHVFSSGGGGIAGVGVVCATGFKARGVTGSSAPVGDSFDVDFVAHEIGHQFAASHTFNAAGAGNCTNGTRSPADAYEPGGGTTIMAYAGICDGQDIQNNSDDYFHANSFDEISQFVSNPATGGSCSAVTATGNSAPTVEAGGDYTIPAQTPFTLNGSATDPDGQALTYHWEEFDLGAAWRNSPVLPNNDSDAARPIFRSYPPLALTWRTFPTLTNILDGSYANKGEILPGRDRTMQFRLTARDNAGGVNYDSMQVTVNATAGPFRVTSPAGSVLWPPASQQVITWDAASTTAPPVSCTAVNILLSTDGGQTFATTLAANTSNDGSETVTLPAGVALSAFVKVECANNIFFDISAPGLAMCTSLFNDDHEGANNWTTTNAVGANSWVRRLDGGFSGNNYWFAEDVPNITDSYLESPLIQATANNLFLRFFHQYDLDEDGGDFYDGGQVQINIAGGGWNEVGAANFTQNGYNATIRTGFGNPMGGELAFGGDSEGYIESIVNLVGVNQGQAFQIRFRQANDSSVADQGWSVDDVLVCSSDTPGAVELSLTKTAVPDPVISGEVLTYTLVVQNNGDLTATDLMITDTVPANTTYIEGSASQEGTAVFTTPGSLITWDTGLDLSPNQALTRTFAVRVDLGLPAGTAITNTAYAAATNTTGGSSDTVATPVLAVAPNLVLTKLASTDTVLSGETLTYTLVARNLGPLVATNITITDTVPASTTYVTGSASDEGTANFPTPGGLITWQTGISLTTNQRLTRTFVVSVDADLAPGSTIMNTGYISATNIAAGQSSNTVITTIASSGSTIYLPLIFK